MKLEEMRNAMRIELQDMSGTVYEQDDLKRAIEKSVSMMSRMLPKREMIETTIVRTYTSESLTIASGTGTLAAKPVKVNSFSISGYTIDTDYTINYLTGVVTSIGVGLPDNTYSVNYELDSNMLDLSSILADYVKLERLEYPAGETPPTLIPFELFGDVLVIGGTDRFTEFNHARLVYLGKWTAPTLTAEGDYPTHLDDAIIIGSCGQALIYKAEKYMQESVSTISAIITLLDELENIVPILQDLTAPTAPSLGALTPPSAYTVIKPTSPTLATKPTAPTPPTLDFSAITSALAKIDTWIAGDSLPSLKKYLLDGDSFINEPTRGADVGATYGKYASISGEGAAAFINEAVARLEQIEKDLKKYASQVTAFGSETNAYANEISGQIGKYREDINAEDLGVRNAVSAAQVFGAEVQAQQAQVNIYEAEVAAYQAQLASLQNEVNIYTARASTILSQVQARTAQIANWLDVSGRYLASGQAKIQEMIIQFGVKTELAVPKTSSDRR